MKICGSKQAGQEPVAKQILQRKWGWIGHTLRKPASSTIRQALTWNLQGKRKRSQPGVMGISKWSLRDADLGNGDGLLLHDLVDGRAVCVHHLVKLINAADAAVGQDQRSSLQHHLPCHWVLHHCCRQTHARRPSPCGVLTCKQVLDFKIQTTLLF